MPYKRKVNKANKKKPYRRGANQYKRKYNKTNMAVIDRMPGKGFADMMYVKLDYAAQIQLTTVAADSLYVNFRGNGLFDPEVATGGHQPLYYDQYAAIYQKYRVLGCKIMMDVINYSGESALQYFVLPSTDVTTSATISDLYEQSRTDAPKIVPIAARIASRYKSYVSTRKVCGLAKSQLYDDTFAANTDSLPTNQWYWNVLFQNLTTAEAVNGWLVVKLTYYVQFFDKVIAAQS